MGSGFYYGADLVSAAREQLLTLATDQKQEAHALEIEKQRLERMLNRLVREADAEPIIEPLFEPFLHRLNTDLCKCMGMISRAEEALNLLKAYSWSVPKELAAGAAKPKRRNQRD